MHRGLLIYNREDYEKNHWFCNHLIEVGKKKDLFIDLVITDELLIGTEGSRLFYMVNGDERDVPDFVINRSRNSRIGYHFELLGSRVFNRSRITDICNHKGKTHQVINHSGIPSVKTIIAEKKYFNISNHWMDYPLVLKSVAGHGGNEVYKIESPAELMEKLENLPGEEFILQEMCSNPGIDIRVFIVGKEIVAAIKRYSETSFKSNYSLGGKATLYELSDAEQQLVRKMINFLDVDFVGIDFILDRDNQLLFNEIEDVVGTRTLYEQSSIDIVEKFVQHIYQKMHQ